VTSGAVERHSSTKPDFIKYRVSSIKYDGENLNFQLPTYAANTSLDMVIKLNRLTDWNVLAFAYWLIIVINYCRVMLCHVMLCYV